MAMILVMLKMMPMMVIMVMLMTAVKFVKSFTPVGFPNLSIVPEKTCKSRHFWPKKGLKRFFYLSILYNLSNFCAHTNPLQLFCDKSSLNSVNFKISAFFCVNS